ncbi:MAG: dihydroxyacetone kinase phosphoryl donor subunit DhaM [Cellulosilyticaceae bacterium]
MVGIVVVSHSQKLAEGIIELAREMAGSELLMVEAAGLEDGSLGTDTTKIIRAIETVETGDGVIIMGDMGSSILSAQTAIELLEDETLKRRIRIADAPLVEGTVIAAIQASIGDNLEDVLKACCETRDLHKL